MELKNYQKQVISDLSLYLELMNQTRSVTGAYNAFWESKGIHIGFGGMPPYNDTLPGVPSLCMKVPTGGGKTYLAANAIKPIFDALPVTKTKVVVWLVPSEVILTQTITTLSNPSHPYRQRIDVDFGSRVEIYKKQQLLSGQNFNPTSVTEQLSICVLSYDSFRGRKEVLKAKQENSNLAEFSKVFGSPENPIEGTDETALLQVINQLSPLVIVDESHHAKSNLSMEMLRNFNPCFVLELTATPKKESNIISYVDAMQLKRENMVKLPVVVYNRDSQTQVLTDAIDLRRKLEEIAVTEQKTTGRYIRPIALFQAQARGKEDNTTFEKLRDRLVEIGIPANHIAIRTADINELKSVDLMSGECPIRYIITVNALKEGWDCPFAYILASLANKTSQIDVEQILGRILRLPHTRQNRIPSLNMSYVLTSSNDFKMTLDGIVRGLNSAGFSDRDCRTASELQIPTGTAYSPKQSEMYVREEPVPYGAAPTEDFLDFDVNTVTRNLADRKENASKESGAENMLAAAEQSNSAYEQSMIQETNDHSFGMLSWEVRDKIATFPVKAEFADEIRKIKIPQFVYAVPESIFIEGHVELLDKDVLSEGFTLKGKPYDIDFTAADTEMVMVDVRDNEGKLPKVFRMSESDQRFIKEYFSKLPPQKRIENCKSIIHNQLNKLNMVDAGELRRYIDLIIDDLTEEQLITLEKSPMTFAMKIRAKVENLLEEHYVKTFDNWIETGKITCEEHYTMPSAIHPSNSTSMIGMTLYEAEEEMNGLERDLVMALTALPNVRWWHRNIARQEFCINGFINHYPDVMIMTQKGNIIFAETKGEHLKNDDSMKKVKLGRAWQNAAGKDYRYYMVFKDTDTLIDGVVNLSHFLEILANL